MCIADVRSFFESTRQAVRDSRACERQLDALARENTPHAQAARARLRSRIESDEAVMADAALVIYDVRLTDANPAYSAVLWWRYLDDATWRKTANMVGRSERSCMYDHDAALAVVDSMGLLDAVAV